MQTTGNFFPRDSKVEFISNTTSGGKATSGRTRKNEQLHLELTRAPQTESFANPRGGVQPRPPGCFLKDGMRKP